MIGNDCRCPGCGTCDAASEVSDLRKSLREWKQKHAELSRMNTSYIKHLHAAERERDDLQAKLDAELPAAWREDLASLNECLDRVGRERDGLREEVARLNTLLLSATGENQKRAEREARALEDWRELRAENDRLKASRLPDVEYARLDTMWQQLVRERDEAQAEVERMRERIATQEDGLRHGEQVCARLVAERDKLRAERRQLRARLVECRPWVGVCPFPNTKGFSEMLAIRDLADDTLEEVKP